MSNTEQGMVPVGETLSAVVKSARSGIDYAHTDETSRGTRAARIAALGTKLGELAAEIEQLNDETKKDQRTLQTGFMQIYNAGQTLLSVGSTNPDAVAAKDIFTRASGLSDDGYAIDSGVGQAHAVTDRSAISMQSALRELSSVRRHIHDASEAAAAAPSHIEEGVALGEEGISHVRTYAETIGVPLSQ